MVSQSDHLSKLAYDEAIRCMASLHRSYDDLRSDYEAAKETRFQKKPLGIVATGSSADYHYATEHDYYYMLELFRDKVRNDPMVSQGVRTFVANVVQDGFVCKPATESKDINDNLEERWRRWSESSMQVDFEHRLNFRAFENLALEAITVDGDLGLNPLQTGDLQHFEAHRIRTPSLQQISMARVGSRRNHKFIHGVEKDSFNRIVRYHVTKDDYDGINRFAMNVRSDFASINAFEQNDITERMEPNFFHLFHPRRFSQTRGVSMIAPIATTSGMHQDIQFAKMVQQQIVSYFAIFRKRPENELLPPADPITTEDNPNYEEDRDEQRIRHKTPLQPGAEFIGDPGEEFQGFSPNVPNAEFFEQARMLLTFISVNFDCPLILFLMDASATNFSGWRGAMDQAKLKFKRVQQWFANTLHRRAYEWKVRQWIQQDLELARAFDSMGLSLFDHEWHLPKWPYIQPLEDTQADILAVTNNMDAPRRVAARKNLDHDTLMREICEDRGALIRCAMETAAELNAHPFIDANPDQRVLWREVAHPALPQGLQMAIDTKTTEGNQNAGNNNRETERARN